MNKPIHTDGQRAKALLAEEETTCAVCRGEQSWRSTAPGVQPLCGWLSAGEDLRGGAAADKIVGKAAALLFVLAGVREVYAPVMSRAAVETFRQQGIVCTFDTLTEGIRNRSNTGPCPMEQAVAEIDDAAEGLRAIQQTIKRLKEQSI